MEWAIGVDGGGTHTRATIVDATGVVRGVRMGGGGNFQSIGATGLQDLLGQLLPPLLALAEPNEVSLCLALAGVGRETEQRQIAAMVKCGGWTGRVRVESDARAALEGAHAGAPGLIVIAGTGSMVLGRNDRDKMLRAGGWGPLLGDEGSGYSMGLQALRAVTRCLDGSGADTALVAALAVELGLEDWDQLVPEVYGGKIDHGCIAALGPAVSNVADCGDAVALHIVDRAGTALAQQVVAVAQRSGMAESVNLSCIGGVFAEGSLLETALMKAIAPQINGLRLCPAHLPAVLGAVLLAWGRNGDLPSQEQLARLRKSRLQGL